MDREPFSVIAAGIGAVATAGAAKSVVSAGGFFVEGRGPDERYLAVGPFALRDEGVGLSGIEIQRIAEPASLTGTKVAVLCLLEEAGVYAGTAGGLDVGAGTAVAEVAESCEFSCLEVVSGTVGGFDFGAGDAVAEAAVELQGGFASGGCGAGA